MRTAVMSCTEPGSASDSLATASLPVSSVASGPGRPARRRYRATSRGHRRSRRATSIRALTASAMPRASSRPTHGRDSKAWPPRRPMKNA